MKIIFLDIDGVLNSAKYMSSNKKEWNSIPLGYGMIDVDSVILANKIIEATQAKVVISSTWRLHFALDELKILLEHKGFIGEIIDRTPSPWMKPGSKFSSPIFSERGEEIQLWLTPKQDSIESFVILDDNSDMAHLKSHLVKTTWEYGINERHVQKAIEMLETKKKLK